MTAEEYKATVLHLLDEAFNKKNPAIFLEVFASDCTVSIAGYREPFRSNDAFKAWAESYHRGFDCQLTVEEIAAEGHNVFVRWNMRALHRGSYLGMPATFRQVQWRALQWSQFKGDRLQNAWVVYDTVRMGQDLGFLPKGSPPRLLAELIAWFHRLKRKPRTPGTDAASERSS